MAVTQAQVAQLYVALFNRAAEGEGLRNWMADGANKTMAQVADTMLQAPAVKTYFNGAIDNDRDFVEMIYKNVLGKDYTQDPNGIDSWVLHLQLGHSRGETLVKLFEVARSDIARAADPVAAKVFDNKIAISEYVSQRIGNVDKDEEGNYNYTLFKQIISETNAYNLAQQKRLVDDAVKVNFTTNVDDINGNNSDNIFETVVSGFMGKNTFQPADKLDGKGGNDTLKVSLDTNFTGLNTGSVKNVENLEITNTSNAVRYFNMNNIEDVKNVVMIGDYASRLTNESKIVTLSANDVKRGEIAIIYNPSTVAGSNDSQELVLENVGNKTDDLVSNPAYNYYKNHVGVKFDGIETLNISTRTQESYIKDVDNKNITVKGNVNLDISTTANVESLDASGFVGNLTAGLQASTQLKSVKGGSGKDLFKFNGIAGANPDLIIDGGANDDSIEFEHLSGTRRLNSSNVENVTFVENNNGTIDLANAQDVKSVTVVENGNTVNVTNSAITTLNIDTDFVEATRVNVTTATLDTINFTDRDLNTYRTPNLTATKQIVANSATKLTMNIDKYSNVSDLGGGEQSLEATSLKTLNMNIEKSADENKYAVDSFRLVDTASLETLNYVNDGMGFELRANDTFQALNKLATLNVKTASSFNIKDLNTSNEAHLRNISEISLQGVIKSDDTTDSDVVLGDLGHNSSLHGINLTAKQLGVLTVGNVITNTQINARFNVNLEDIRDNATFGNVKSGNTVIIAKTLAKDLTIGDMDADTIATGSTDNVRMVIVDVEGGVDIGNIVNLSSLDGDFRNIKKDFTLGDITNSKAKSAILLNFVDIKGNVGVARNDLEASEVKIVAKNVEKTFNLGNIDLKATATNGKAHEGVLSLDGIKDAVTIGDISNLNSLNGDFKNLGDSITIGDINGTQIDSTTSLKFTNVKDSVSVGDFGSGDVNHGSTYTVTADKLAKGLTIGDIYIAESPDFYDVHKSAVNITSGKTEGVVQLGTIDTGADSKVTIDLSKSLQANVVGNIKGGEIVYKGSAITPSNAVTLEVASTDKVNVDSKIDVTASVGQDEFVFKSTEDAKTFTVTGTLGDGEDKYTLDLVASNNLKTVNLSGLKSAEHGVIDLTTVLTANKQSLSLVATDGKDVITVGAIAEAGTTDEPNVVTIDGGRGVDTFKLKDATTDADASKYVSLVNIEKGDKIDLDTVTQWAKYTAADLNAEATLKDAVNKVLTDAAATVANKVWAFTYKNDTYLVRDIDGGRTDLTDNDNLVKLAGYNIEDLNPSLDSGVFTI
nr:hypothetical protein [uncultured Campylobacter sp.]